jgi:predicted enzyme related to lactoylglutathione lyase
MHGRFAWYELMTTDVAAATAFYTEVVGWRAQDASAPGATYTLLGVGERAVGGLMSLPPDVGAAGATPRWVGYVEVDDVGAAVDRIAQRGGMVHLPPLEIPDVSRIAIVADPQTAMFGVISWLGADQERAAATGGPGRGSWHELLAADADTAFAFYADLLGWQKAETGVDRDGTYQLFSAAGETIGGMFAKPATTPFAFWLYYFGVADIDAAAERVRAAGGEILEGPVDVRGGAGALRCTDPQGAMFALIGPRDKSGAGYFERTGSRSPSEARGRRWSW